MKKNSITYLIDIILLIIFLIVGITGIIIFPDFLKILGFNINNFPKVEIYKYHHWFGIILLVITSIHIDRYWKIFFNSSKKIIKKIKDFEGFSFNKNNIKIILNLFLIISFSLVFTTGIIKFPGFLPFIGLNPLSIPLNFITLIHDYSGLTAVILTIFHILLYIKRFLKTTQTNLHLLNSGNNNKIIILIIFIILISILGIFLLINSEDNYNINIFGEKNEIIIDGVGVFSFNPDNISSIRDDIFQLGYFSIFDILIYLNDNDNIELSYHFDESMNTHIIDSINNQINWWYEAYYDGGWSENNVYRLDHYPYKQKMFIKLHHASSDRINDIYNTFKNEISRNNENLNKIIIPEVIIIGTGKKLTFDNVEVTPHNLRNDVFINGTVTAIDVIFSLEDKNLISYDLKWYDSIGSAEIVRSYWIDGINNDKTSGRCGFVYEEGSNKFNGFRGNHIHIPSDMRVINSPEYIKWFWICI